MIDEIIEKYSNTTLSNLRKENVLKIIEFLQKENCDYIEDLIEDYLDLFTIEYEEFKRKYYQLNDKYHHVFLLLASEDMNLLEEFF